MNIVVIMKLVPDLVEELEIAENGKSLDMDWLRLIINEFDDHALEQAVLIKEQGDAQVTVVSPELEGVEDILYTASARGADRVIKLLGDFEDGANSHALARAYADVVRDLQPDLILTGVQANDDLDGAIGPLLAESLGYPYVGYISGMSVENSETNVKKEYPGGLIAEMKVLLPAVFGIQAAEEPPRYIAISKVRQAMKTTEIEEIEISELISDGGPSIERMYIPETGERAQMIEGDEEEVAQKLIDLFNELGVLK
jgi:electron transfer flavoprotein beta subunit